VAHTPTPTLMGSNMTPNFGIWSTLLCQISPHQATSHTTAVKVTRSFWPDLTNSRSLAWAFMGSWCEHHHRWWQSAKVVT